MNKIRLTKEEWSWSLYDVANSAFILLLTAVIPVYVKSMGAKIGVTDTVTPWGFVQSISTFSVALLAPILGVLADKKGKKKLYFAAFFLFAIVMLGVMAISDNFYFLLIVNLLVMIGYSGANIFYDAFLIDITDNKRMDYVSSFGYAIGYIGSCVPFVVSIALIMFGSKIGLSGTLPIKLSLMITLIWWAAFTIPFFRNVKQKYGTEPPEGQNAVGFAFRKVLGTTKKIFHTKTLALFLLAYFFYIDGVDTIIKMSVTYGANVGIADKDLILALLLTQVLAFPAVLILGRMTKKISAKKIILFSIILYTGICIFGYFLEKAWQFWTLAVAVALVQGSIQALSRSYFGKLIPNKDNSNEYFGFYNIFGKYSAIFGPLLMSLFTLITGSARYGILSLILLFIAGFFTFLKVPDVGSMKNAQD